MPAAAGRRRLREHVASRRAIGVDRSFTQGPQLAGDIPFCTGNDQTLEILMYTPNNDW
jgi:hypothetical protein